MVADWTTDQVLALAPDAGAAKAGKGLAMLPHWGNLGRSDSAVWGECQGSGSKPYQTRIDLTEPAFKCTCPSHKFPCKHSLGLFLLYAQDRSVLAESEPPGWVAEWLAARVERSQKKTERAVAEAKPPDPKQQAKRAEQRQNRVEQGIEELDLWVRDLVRHGLAWAQTRPRNMWTDMAARMVDAQAPGLARQIQELAQEASSGEGWQSRMMKRMARLHLLLQGWKRMGELEPDVQNDLRIAIGFPIPRETVLAQPEVRDHWIVMSQEYEDGDDGLRIQSICLWGIKTSRPALILSFAHAKAPSFDFVLPAGVMMEGAVAYYPSATPLRALIKEHQRTSFDLSEMNGYPTAGSAMKAYAQSLGRNPWIVRFPMLLNKAYFVRVKDSWMLEDEEQRLLPVQMTDFAGWRGLAATGGKACGVFGEWNGESFRVRSMISSGQLTVLY